jgi:hypothetical protein
MVAHPPTSRDISRPIVVWSFAKACSSQLPSYTAFCDVLGRENRYRGGRGVAEPKVLGSSR